MIPHVVVDIGNTRMKWGRVGDGGIAETAALGRYPSAEWQEVLDRWQISTDGSWLVASVDPNRTTEFDLRFDETGLHEGVCAEFCGLDHTIMRFEVDALPPAEFARWLDQARGAS